VRAEQLGELRDERDIAHRGKRLRRDARGRRTAVGARELRAHVNHSGGEVEVVPDEAEQLGDAQAGKENRRQHQPIARRADREQALDLSAAQHALAPPLWPGALFVLEQLDRVGHDPATAAGKTHHALQRRERAG
jgi:hypothetical protein